MYRWGYQVFDIERKTGILPPMLSGTTLIYFLVVNNDENGRSGKYQHGDYKVQNRKCNLILSEINGIVADCILVD